MIKLHLNLSFPDSVLQLQYGNYKKEKNMKTIILFTGLLAAAQVTTAQLKSSNLNVPASAQPVPNSTVTEKSAPTPKPLIAPAANPIPPVYPGAEARVAETQRETVFPAAPPSPTQPAQREPLTPIDATNVLQPTRPQREEASRPQTRGVSVQRTTRPTGVEQAKLSGQTAAIENPHDRKPVVTRTSNVPATRTSVKIAKTGQRKGGQLMSSEKPISERKINNAKKYKKKKYAYRKK